MKERLGGEAKRRGPGVDMEEMRMSRGRRRGTEERDEHEEEGVKKDTEERDGGEGRAPV